MPARYRSGFSTSRQPSDHGQGDHDLGQNEERQGGRLSGKRGFNPDQLRKEHGQVGRVEPNDCKQQPSGSSVDAPAYNPKPQLEEERQEGTAAVEPGTQFVHFESRRDRDARTVGYEVQEEMRRYPECDGDCSFWSSKGKPNQSPGDHRKDQGRGNRMRPRHVHQMNVLNRANAEVAERQITPYRCYVAWDANRKGRSCRLCSPATLVRDPRRAALGGLKASRLRSASGIRQTRFRSSLR